MKRATQCHATPEGVVLCGHLAEGKAPCIGCPARKRRPAPKPKPAGLWQRHDQAATTHNLR